MGAHRMFEKSKGTVFAFAMKYSCRSINLNGRTWQLWRSSDGRNDKFNVLQFVDFFFADGISSAKFSQRFRLWRRFWWIIFLFCLKGRRLLKNVRENEKWSIAMEFNQLPQDADGVSGEVSFFGERKGNIGGNEMAMKQTSKSSWN